MIFDELALTTKSLQELKRKTDLVNNKVMQDNTDTKFRLVLSQSKAFVDTLEYLYLEAKVCKNNDIINAISELFKMIEEAIASGLAINDEVNKCDNSFKQLSGEMKKEWSKQYASLSSATLSTLDAVKGIDSENVEKCVQKIKNANTWECSIKTYKTMFEGIGDAELLIDKLGLDDEIIEFLQKTNSGTATLKNMNDKVLNWLRNENMENKIRISFIRRS